MGNGYLSYLSGSVGVLVLGTELPALEKVGLVGVLALIAIQLYRDGKATQRRTEKLVEQVGLLAKSASASIAASTVKTDEIVRIVAALTDAVNRTLAIKDKIE